MPDRAGAGIHWGHSRSPRQGARRCTTAADTRLHVPDLARALCGKSTVTRRVSSPSTCLTSPAISCGALRYSACGSARSAVSGCRGRCLARGGRWCTARPRAVSALIAAVAGGRRGRPAPSAGAGNAKAT